ncbi:MAG: bifunctional methylenetetrahydrofolate dehydrogenase/methenyltetrahydrofolate cyclohydrolase FolD [Rhodanobacteraceae bacterium]|nr:bifunctional methylenetetrahydrofolate dehydrogenase/methenyltetrahydrofolate cyclohydrolase FolD [Rhodanobacteraceae bacterium]
MSAQILDGKLLAAQLREQVAAKVSALRASGKRAPGLAVVLVGGDPASQVYVGMKEKMTEAVGMHSVAHRLPETTSEQELLAVVAALNADPAVDGILVQLPLPAHLNSELIINTIDPAKDVDGFHPVNVGRLSAGLPALVPCTPRGCIMLAKLARADLSGLHAVVVGRSNIVGKPVAQLLLQENCTVTIAHSRTRDLPALCRTADLLVAAIGRPKYLGAQHVKPGAIVIDVGINRITTAEGSSKLVGDVDYDAAAEVAGAITPVPGGVGPMTIACLLDNTLTAYERRAE